MTHNIELYQEWIVKAADDELSIQAVLDSGAPSTACFLAQQMAEKYLKSLLVYHKQEVLKVHDLLALESTLLEFEPNCSSIHAELKQLNRYYIETRYPGDYPEFSKLEAIAAQHAAQKVKEFAETVIADNGIS